MAEQISQIDGLLGTQFPLTARDLADARDISLREMDAQLADELKLSRESRMYPNAIRTPGGEVDERGHFRIPLEDALFAHAGNEGILRTLGDIATDAAKQDPKQAKLREKLRKPDGRMPFRAEPSPNLSQ